MIRRVVQPKLVTARTVSENEKTPSMITSSVSPENIAVDGSTANMPAVKVLQVDSTCLKMVDNLAKIKNYYFFNKCVLTVLASW